MRSERERNAARGTETPVTPLPHTQLVAVAVAAKNASDAQSSASTRIVSIASATVEQHNESGAQQPVAAVDVLEQLSLQVLSIGIFTTLCFLCYCVSSFLFPCY